MAKTQTYSMEKILAMREILRKLPAKEKEKSKAELVEFLKTDLRKAVKQGHSLKEIQAILAEQGVNVPLSRMEAVLGESGKESVRKKAGKLTVQETHEVSKNSPVKPENVNTAPTRKSEAEKEPSFYTPDIPDAEL
jgi:hypothetical protein